MNFRLESYFFQRLLSISKQPESRASPLTVEPASISGTGVALAVATIPTSSNINPTTFMRYSPSADLKAGYFFQRLLIMSRLPDSRASALTDEPASISGTVTALAVIIIPTNSNIIPKIFTCYPLA